MKDRLWSSTDKSHSAYAHTSRCRHTHTRMHTLLMINYKTHFQQQQGYNLEVKGTLPPGKDLKTDTHTHTHAYTHVMDAVAARARRSSL